MAEIRKKNLSELLESVDRRMNSLEQKSNQFKKEIIHRFHVISEDVISQVKLVAEGVMNLDEKLLMRP
jgi:transcriptional regulator of heat shock response